MTSGIDPVTQREVMGTMRSTDAPEITLALRYGHFIRGANDALTG